ncbi:Plasmodium exported protein, unknown function [Plasmodium ovale]|uniref:Uncharacterized protein n=1 Tax=Plasmodium ovale TaxID=36330 RepID=A0A1D3RCX6_PLAOA|nr:Plasmodium exported protein, unknown function [Plasmodium ovale]
MVKKYCNSICKILDDANGGNATTAATFYYDRGSNVLSKEELKKLQRKGKMSMLFFLIKAFIFAHLIWILQFYAINVTFHESGKESYDMRNGNASIFRNNRMLIENLRNINSSYETLEQNIVDRIENIYEQQTRNIASKIMGFIKKIDLIVEKEIVKTLKYIDAEKDEPIQSGINFFEKVKNFFKGLQLFSTPILGTITALTAYYFKSQVFTTAVTLTVAFLPLISTCYLFYKIYKIRSETLK